MATREDIERQIRDTIAGETRAIALSNRLFSPDGLFNELAHTEDERRAVVQAPLFKEAQRRFMELQRAEAASFGRALEQTCVALPGDKFFLRLEKTEGT